ncbi:MAG: hypothetical protein GY953_25255, partial [bacterium]|nr:hypothetical protein [bacterium]
MRTSTATLAMSVLLAAPSIFAWGEEGHKIVCEVAFQNLSDEARGAVLRLRNNQYPNFSSSCLWADEVRRTSHKYTYNYHFINFPEGAQDPDAADYCPAPKRCAPWAIRHYAKKFGDENASKSERREAMRFLAHFVGDIHQPLHAGYDVDLGGNSIKVRYLNKPYKQKLHAIWDTTILTDAGMEWPYTGEELSETFADSGSAWQDFDTDGWAVESYRLAEEYAYGTKKNGNKITPNSKLKNSYATRALPIVEEQLAKAGFR